MSPQAEAEQIERLKAWRSGRDQKAVKAALVELRAAAQQNRNVMPASIACAKAGVTTGEWGFALRESFGEYRAPTGVGRAARNETFGLDDLRAEVERVSRKLGRRLKFVLGKPGLDGHSNGAEQIAVRARDAGIEVIYHGIRLTPAEIVAAARERAGACRRPVHPVGLACAAGQGRGRAHAGGGARRRSVGGRRHHSAGGCLRAQASRGERRLYAQGLRIEPHHDRYGAIVEAAAADAA